MKSKPPTKREVAALVEYVRKRLRELKAIPSLIELEEFVECVRVKLPLLTYEQALEIVRLGLHKTPRSQIIPDVVPITMGRPPKLTPEQQADALQRLGRGETQADVAKSYGVDRSVISRLRSDKWNLRG